MILKVVKKEVLKDMEDREIYTPLITEHYESESFKQEGIYMINKKGEEIPIENYSRLNEFKKIGNTTIKNYEEHFEILSVYLMNNEGKTIEKIR